MSSTILFGVLFVIIVVAIIWSAIKYSKESS